MTRKIGEVMGAWKEDAFNITFRPHRVNRFFLYFNDLTMPPPSLAAFTCLLCHVVLSQLVLPSYRGHAIAAAETARSPE